MAIILFILAAGVLLISIFIFFQTQNKQRSYQKNNRIFSEAWGRIDNKKVNAHNHGDGEGFHLDLLLRIFKNRRKYYRDVYLKSAARQRKRFVVFKRDNNWCCVHFGTPATLVHHKKYANRIGNEPTEWLESVCNACHCSLHQ